MNVKVTTITDLRNQRDSHLRDMSRIEQLGRVYGKSIALPVDDAGENIPYIREGVVALSEAAEFFAIADTDSEQYSIVDHFFEGARQFSRIGSFEIQFMLSKLAKNIK